MIERAESEIIEAQQNLDRHLASMAAAEAEAVAQLQDEPEHGELVEPAKSVPVAPKKKGVAR